jgi:hypothetical protein
VSSRTVRAIQRNPVSKQQQQQQKQQKKKKKFPVTVFLYSDKAIRQLFISLNLASSRFLEPGKDNHIIFQNITRTVVMTFTVIY